MNDTLRAILAATRERVADGKSRVDGKELKTRVAAAPPSRGFAAALIRARAEGRIGLIAEIKRASPSRGVIRSRFEPRAIARAYEVGGASCLSVLTEPHWFDGDLEHLREARAACALPVLRKDFIVDPWQLAEARAAGADCVLLILAALSDGEAAALEEEALELGLDVLVEAHDAEEVERALRLKTPLIGINNRDLRTLEVDPLRALYLGAIVPDNSLVIAESGIRTNADLRTYCASGISTFLVGESLMAQPDTAEATRRLIHG